MTASIFIHGTRPGRTTGSIEGIPRFHFIIIALGAGIFNQIQQFSEEVVHKVMNMFRVNLQSPLVGPSRTNHPTSLLSGARPCCAWCCP